MRKKMEEYRSRLTESAPFLPNINEFHVPGSVFQKALRQRNIKNLPSFKRAKVPMRELRAYRRPTLKSLWDQVNKVEEQKLVKAREWVPTSIEKKNSRPRILPALRAKETRKLRTLKEHLRKRKETSMQLHIDAMARGERQEQMTRIQSEANEIMQTVLHTFHLDAMPT